MNGTGYQSLLYVESLDSVRCARAETAEDAAPGGDIEEDLHELQVFLEVLMSLSLGRDLVIPQSYAFDSRSFLSIAEPVLKARDAAHDYRARGFDRPFRLHLFGPGIETFDDAIRAMLTRVHDPTRPFVSSLLPQLSARSPREVSAMTEDLGRLLTWMDDRDADLLAKVRSEFSKLRPVAARPRRTPGALDRLVQLINSSSTVPQAAANDDNLSAAVHEKIVDAIRELHPTTTTPDALVSFAQRSRLRQDLPWPGDSAARSAREIVGTERLDLVIEFVDTLYNRAVFDSIGIATAVFSTSVTVGEELQLARAVAQHLALTDSGSADPPSGAPADPDGPSGFDLRLRADALHHGRAVQVEARQLSKDRIDILTRLMAERSQGRDAASRSRFWSSINRLDMALAGNDVRSVRRALESHIELLAKILGDGAEVGLTADWRVQVLMVSGGAAGPGIAAETWQWPGLGVYAAAAVGAAAPEVLRRAGDMAKRLRGNRRRASALNEFVDVSPHIPPGGAS